MDNSEHAILHKAATLQSFDDAKKEFISSFYKLENTYREYLTTNLVPLDPENRSNHLIQIAQSNPADWSGGMTNPGNILATIKREIALDLLIGNDSGSEQ